MSGPSSAGNPATELPWAHPSLGPTRLGRGPLVFAVESTCAQLTWQSIHAHPQVEGPRLSDTRGRRTGHLAGDDIGATLTARNQDTGFQLGSAPWAEGTGCLELTGLPAGATTTVVLDVDGEPVGRARLTTLRPLGSERFRFATISDVHLGLDVFGVRGTMVEAGDPHPKPANLRAAAAAIAEATAWGAQHLFIKGDLVDRSTPANWALAGALLAECTLPVTVMSGNHEHNREALIGPMAGAASIGVDAVDGARRVDLPDLSVLCVDTPRPGAHEGWVTPRVSGAAAELAADAPAPVMVLTHHPIERFDRAWSYPPGVPRNQGEALLSAIGDRCELLLASAGHTHSHRRRRIGGVTTTEVGSPKDYPGVWAGYTVHGHGIRQVIRRVNASHTSDWLHHTRWAVAGAWGRWSPGRLTDRSLQVRRAARQPPAPTPVPPGPGDR